MRLFWILLFFVLLFSLEGVVAWGVSAPYWNGRPLHLGQGEDTEVVLLLQNMVGDKDITLKAELVSGGEIVDFDGALVDVPFGVKDKQLPLKLDISRKADIGGEYMVAVSFQPVVESGSGNVGLSGRAVTSFPVIVDEPDLSPLERAYTNPWVIVGLVIVLGIVIYLLRRRKKSR